MIALARLVVVAHRANPIHDQSQAVFEAVDTARHGRRNLPNHDVGKAVVAQRDAGFLKKIGFHVVTMTTLQSVVNTPTLDPARRSGERAILSQPYLKKGDAVKRWMILSLALATVPAFGQSTPPAKTYKWQHPWFKKEITSPTPPTWPYRVIEEKNGVVRVEVTPPDAKKASPTIQESPVSTDQPSVPEPIPSPTSYQPTPPQTVPPAPLPQDRQQAFDKRDQKKVCDAMGDLSDSAWEAKKNGVSQIAAESMVVLSASKQLDPSLLDTVRNIVKAVYAHNEWTKLEARMNVGVACETSW